MNLWSAKMISSSSRVRSGILLGRLKGLNQDYRFLLPKSIITQRKVFLTVQYYGTGRNTFFFRTREVSPPRGLTDSFARYAWLFLANSNQSQSAFTSSRSKILSLSVFLNLFKPFGSRQFPCTSGPKLSVPQLISSGGVYFLLFSTKWFLVFLAGGVVLCFLTSFGFCQSGFCNKSGHLLSCGSFAINLL